jgi:predicted ATPase
MPARRSPPMPLARPDETAASPVRIVLTGGPGAGKTAVLEMARRELCADVVVLKEAASILFRGGFPRADDIPARRAAQRAIYHVTSQLEQLELDRNRASALLCDRGTVDGAAYWPGTTEDYFEALGTTREAEHARYHAVLHLRVPRDGNGYDFTNPVRTESAAEAARIDAAIFDLWTGHPRRYVVENADDFAHKVERALERLREVVPRRRAHVCEPEPA